MSNDQPTRRPPAKSSGGGAPMGSTISIAIAVIAVVVGFLILRNINDSDSGSSSSADPGVTTTSSPGGTDDTTQTTTPIEVGPVTTPPIIVQGATVIVANASGTNGAAGNFMTALKNAGFTTAEAATNATGTEQKLATSKVYYVEGPGPLAVATSVAQVMGPGVTVELIPTPAPVDNADLKTATVLVMLGSDLAGKPLYALAPTTADTSLPASPIDSSTSIP